MIIFNIAATEWRRMFQTPLAWVVLAIVQFLLAIFFFVLLSKFLEPAGPAAGRGVTDIVVAGTFQIAGIVLLLVAPLLTMRLFSEDQRSGVMQLLASAPISLSEIVLGKYLGILGFLVGMLAMIALMPLSLLAGTSLDMGQLAAGLLALALLMAAFAAIGLFVSTLTDQPALAAVGGFAALFILWIIQIAGSTSSESVAAVFAYLSLLRHYDSLLDGYFSSVDVVYYVLIIAMFLALSVWRLDARRTYH